MPYQTRIIGAVIWTEFFAEVSMVDLYSVAATVAQLECGRPDMKGRLADLRKVTSAQITFSVVEEFVRRRKAVLLPSPIKSAVIAKAPFHFGFARMFQSLNDHPQIEIRIFDDETEAVHWLEESV